MSAPAGLRALPPVQRAALAACVSRGPLQRAAGGYRPVREGDEKLSGPFTSIALYKLQRAGLVDFPNGEAECVPTDLGRRLAEPERTR